MADEKQTGNVTPIDGARKKKNKTTVREEQKLKIAEAYRMIADAIRQVTHHGLPEFPYSYRVLEPEEGSRIPMIVDDELALRVVGVKALQKDVLTYTDRQLGGRPDFTLKPQQAKEAAEYYLLSTDPVPSSDIKITRWKDEPGYTYRRLPWIKKVGPCPSWDTLLSRMTNEQAFRDWIGTLFFEESYLQNYVWIYGGGGDGKGAINRFLAKVFGASYRSKQSPMVGQARDKFWTYGLLGARLVVFPECDDPKFVTNGLFKSLTGGDPVDVEAKGSMSFTVNLMAKYLILSNKLPVISLAPSDLRRIIFCEIAPSAGIDLTFEQKLWEEGGFFLSRCVEQYLSSYPQHGPLADEKEAIQDLAATCEEEFSEIFNQWFSLDTTTYVTPRQMVDIVSAEWPRDRKQQHHFRAWLDNKHGIRRKRVRLAEATQDKDLEWRYEGLKILKIPPERNRGRELG